MNPNEIPWDLRYLLTANMVYLYNHALQRFIFERNEWKVDYLCACIPWKIFSVYMVHLKIAPWNRRFAAWKPSFFGSMFKLGSVPGVPLLHPFPISTIFFLVDFWRTCGLQRKLQPPPPMEVTCNRMWWAVVSCWSFREIGRGWDKQNLWGSKQLMANCSDILKLVEQIRLDLWD